MQLHDAEGHEGGAVPEASSGVGRSDAPTIHSFKWRRAGFLVAVATFVTTMAAVGVSGSWRATDRPGVAAPNPMTTILNTTPRVEVRRNGPSEVVDSAVASLGVTPGDRSVTATTRPLATAGPVASPLRIDERIPLRILAVRPNNPRLAVIDFDAHSTTIYAPGVHSLPLDATDGAVMTPNREVVIWTLGAARLFTGRLNEPGVVLGGEPPRETDGFAPTLRVVPTPKGELAWLVQPGISYGDSDYHPTLVSLIDLSTGRVLMNAQADANSFPVAAT